MKRLSERKIVLVTRKTRVDDLVARFNTESQARFYIEHLGDDYGDYRSEHDQYYRCLKACTILLSQYGRLHRVDRGFLPNYTFGPEDVIVVLGQDGLVANTMKYLDGHGVVGVNPDPARWDGVLLPFTVSDLRTVMAEVMAGRRPLREITMAKATLNTGDEMHAVNDFFIGPKSHTSARYFIHANGTSEEQSSSGVIVFTGLGSTGWFKSLMAGAAGIAASLSGKLMEDADNSAGGFAWESDYLRFTVREPFPSTSSRATIVFGHIDRHHPLKLVSRMSNQGVIFSDGIEKDYLQFNSGTEAEIAVADKKGRIVQ